MDINQEISVFLKSKSSYMLGVSLYHKIYPNNFLVKTLYAKESKKNWQKVIYELEKYLKINDYDRYKAIRQETDDALDNQTLQRQARKEKNHRSRSENISRNSSPLRQDEPSSFTSQSDSNHSQSSGNGILLSRVADKRILLYRERGHLHGRLHEAVNDEQRYELAKSIIEIQNKIESINHDFDLVKQNKIPKGFFQEFLSAKEYKEMQNIKRYIARHKRNALAATDEDQRKNYTDKVEHYELKLKKLLNYARYQEV